MTERPERPDVWILSAPSNLGLRPPASGREPGVRELPAALLRLGLLELLSAADAGAVPAPPYDPTLDPRSGIRNASSLRSYTIELAERVGTLLDGSCFPLVLGGDCSILLGSALALRRRGRFGLLFLDGHTDLLTPATSQTGGVAGMDLAIVTGTEVGELASIDELRPYVRPEDVAVFGFRWPKETDETSGQPRAPMLSLPLEGIRRQGLAESAEQAVAHFAGRGFWVHLDADVLDPTWMPAVDSPEPGGMRPDELATVLRIALRAKNCVGVELTIYDPSLDPTGDGASVLVQLLRDALTG